MIVLIAGMPRSGSTFTFNIARETLQRSGGVAQIAIDTLQGALAHFDVEQHLLIKSHGTDDAFGRLVRAGGAVCICSFRRPEEAIASWMRTFGSEFEEALGVVEAWLRWHQRFAHLSTNIDCRDIEARPLRTILHIQQRLIRRIDLPAAWRLRRAYDRERVAAEVADLKRSESTVDVGFSYYDRTTFFHRRHISPPGQRAATHTLSAEQIEHVRAQLAGFVNNRGDYVLNT